MQMGETYRRTNVTATLHRSGLYGVVAKLNPLLSEDVWKHTLNLQKQHLKDPQTVRNNIIWPDEDYLASIQNIKFEGNQLCSSPAEYHPKSKVCW